MSAPVYFKYRPMDNWQFILDIFLNRRLYAATFDKLNDPMEGRYLYHGDTVTRKFIRSVYSAKRKRRICSLSRNYKNTLLWSYYGGGHSGIAIGVGVRKRKNSDYTIEPINYVTDVILNRAFETPIAVADDILLKKLKAWQHEDEVRVLTKDEYVDIYIKQVILGCQISDFNRSLIEKLVLKCCPKTTSIVALKRRDLDRRSRTS